MIYLDPFLTQQNRDGSLEARTTRLLRSLQQTLEDGQSAFHREINEVCKLLGNQVGFPKDQHIPTPAELRTIASLLNKNR